MAGPKFSYDIGYAGSVKISSQPILATGGSLSVQYTPLYTSGVWGAGWFNTSQKIAYAPNYVTLSSSVNYQLTKGITQLLSNWAFYKRNEDAPYEILPNGTAGYSGNAYCIGCSFSASQDSLVTGDINLKTGHVQGTIKTTAPTSDGNAKTGTTSLTSIASTYLDVYPFWASCVYATTNNEYNTRIVPTAISSSDKWTYDNEEISITQDIIDWNASYSSDLVFVMTCAATSDKLSTTGDGVLNAQYCCLGSMDATGSFTIFRINELLKPNAIRCTRKAYIKLKKSDGSGICGIKFGSIIFDSGSTDIQTGTSFIQSSFNFTALGSGYTPPMLFDVVS